MYVMRKVFVEEHYCTVVINYFIIINHNIFTIIMWMYNIKPLPAIGICSYVLIHTTVSIRILLIVSSVVLRGTIN